MSTHVRETDRQRSDTPLLRIRDLTVRLGPMQAKGRDRNISTTYAVRNLNLDLWPGEAVGLVGESGSGKSLTAKSLMGLIPQAAHAQVSGTALLAGEDLLAMSEKQLHRIRGKKLAMIFQDPMTALSPFFTIRAQLTETLRTHDSLTQHQADQRSVSLLGNVGIHAPEEKLNLYPHQFSGGMRQRVVIAMALAHQPALLIADEPTTGLDAVTQVQLLELIKGLCHRNQNMGVLFISHDVGAVATLCDRTAVMYAGQIVEVNKTHQLLKEPSHPYTAALLNCLPQWAPRNSYSLSALEGFPPKPSADEPLHGCSFAPRCQRAAAMCRTTSVQWTARSGSSGLRCLLPLQPMQMEGAHS
jgi:peptide/nickel transport system permease protein